MARSGEGCCFSGTDSCDFDSSMLLVGVAVVGIVVIVPITVAVMVPRILVFLLGCNHHPMGLGRGTQGKGGTENYG